MPVWTGALVTAGDVAFYGTMDRWFKAVDAKDGKPLWQFHAGSGMIGQPVTYQGPTARSMSRSSRASAAGRASSPTRRWIPRVRNGALGFTGATQDLPTYTQGGGELVVFALPKATNAAGEPAQPPKP